MTDPEIQERIKTLRRKRQVPKRQLTWLEKFIEQKGENATIHELETRHTSLAKTLESFQKIQDELEEIDETEVCQEDRVEFEDRFFTVDALLMELKALRAPMNDSLNATINPNQSVVVDIPNYDLPRINVPKFNGDYLSWPSFINQFDTLVHNNTSKGMTGTRKLTLLLDALDERKVRPVIANIPISDENYLVARKMLTDRYERKRLIFEAFVKKLWNLQNAVNTQGLRALSDGVNAQLEALKLIATKDQISDGILIFLVMRKMDERSISKWEEASAGKDALPTWDEFHQFLEKRCTTLECIDFASTSTKFQKPKISSNDSPKKVFAATAAGVKCISCNGGCASLELCSTFMGMTPKQRSNHIKSVNYCWRCLIAPSSDAHSNSCCVLCTHCHKPHNSLLHYGKLSERSIERSNSNDVANMNQIVTNASGQNGCNDMPNNYIFLGTAIINVRSANGELIPLRVLLDGGAQLTIITTKASEMLGLPYESTSVGLKGIHGELRNLKHCVEINFEAASGKLKGTIWATVNPYFDERQPAQFIDISKWKFPRSGKLADPSFNVPNEIDMVINAHYAYEWLLPSKWTRKGQPALQKTLLGWVAVGGLYNDCSPYSVRNNSGTVTTHSSEDSFGELMKLLHRFWEIEEVPFTSKLYSEEEQRTMDHFRDTVTRDESGRVIVKHAFKQHPDTLGNSYGIAMRRLCSLERQIAKNPQVQPMFDEFMREYFELGHCAYVPKINGKAYFIPYSYVLKPDSTTTKLRVVFDASSRTDTGVSLNDVLSKGPVIQDSLFTHLIRFQLWPIALSGDICKMYRQVSVAEEDRKWQCILYRTNALDKPQIVQLNTVTYGVITSSYQCTEALRYAATIYKTRFPLAARVIEKNFYIDDGIMGAFTIEEAFKIYVEVKELLMLIGMEMRKWSSSCSKVLGKIPEDDRGKGMHLVDDKEVLKTLGCHWIPDVDCLLYRIQVPEGPITARTVISETARVYDPLGKIQPVVVRLKIFMQRTTSAMQGAIDDPLPESEQRVWQEAREELSSLEQLRIPRYVLVHTKPRAVQIHCFSDASSKAYAANVYIRAESSSGAIQVNLLCAKSRVAPLAKRTLPRLELCGALLMAQLWSSVKALIPEIIRCPIEAVYFWVDASIVYHQVHNSPHKYVPFVAVRLTEIQNLSKGVNWRHVPTELNPADKASRGQKPCEFLKNNLWFHGPSYLCESEDKWPNKLPKFKDSVEDVAPNIQLVATTPSQDDITNRKLIGWNHMRRIFAYVAKFIRLTRKIPGTNKGRLTTDDLENGMLIAVKFVQQATLKPIMSMVTSNSPIEKRNFLLKYCPFIDSDGILRIGGRLSNSELPENSKFPIVLPADHWFTVTMLVHLHYENLHAGAKTLLNLVRQRFFPIKGKILVNRIVNRCLRCRWVKPITFRQIMGNLPKSRVTIGSAVRPFVHTGVDFAGPIMVKQHGRGRTRLKAYICLFVCLVTKTVHIELVDDLTTDGVMNALQRFASRRGAPFEIWSDNGTNLMGARNELRALGELLSSQDAQDKIRDWCNVKLGANWRSIPPRSPHFGGMWESAIKIAKYHLIRALGHAELRHSELETVLCMTEAVLNSRPLVPVSADPRDDLPITPGHFVIGEALKSVPEPYLEGANPSHLKRWKRVVALKQQIFKKLRDEYWHDLQARYKWSTGASNAKVGMKVLINDKTKPSLRWPWGVIESISMGTDGKVRVVKVKNKVGTYERSIREICPLPFEDEEDCDMDDVISSSGPSLAK